MTTPLTLPDPDRIRLEIAQLYDNDAGMPSIGLFFDRVQRALLLTQRSAVAGALMLMDIALTDPAAPGAREALQRATMQVAFLIQSEIRALDSVTMLAVNQYAILLTVTEPDTGAVAASQRLLERLPVIAADLQVNAELRCSIGSCDFPPRVPVHELYRRTCTMLREAHASGGGHRAWDGSSPASVSAPS